MGNINENSVDYKSLKDKLSAIILLETTKPYEEIDCDLVDECIDFLMELEGRKRLSKKEIRRRIGKIPFKENILKFNEAARRKVKAKRIAIVTAIMAIIMAIIGVMSIASEDIFGDLLAKYGRPFIRFMDNEIVEYSGNTIYNADDIHTYESVEEMAEAENINILCPSWLPEGVEVESAIRIVDREETAYSIYCNSPDFSVTMYPEKPLDERTKTNSCKEINGFKIYYFSKNSVTQGNFIYKNILYSVSADSSDNLFKIIESLKEIN